MGKFNEIQEQTTQSWGSNSFTTTIKDNTVEFDSAKDKFTFTDPVEVPSITIGGSNSVPFTSEDRTKLDNLQTPMQIKGRVDTVEDLDDLTDVTVGDVYLVGESGQETFEEYVCTGFDGSDESAIWESVGKTQAQADWNQNDSTASDYVKNRICYEETVGREYYNQSEGYETIDVGDDNALEKYEVITLESFIGRTLTVNLGGETETFDTSDYVTAGEGLYAVGDEGMCMLLTVPNQEIGLDEGLYFMSSIGGVSVQYNLTGKSEIHTLADKYLSENIARVSDIPEQAFELDESVYNIVSKFTNETNTVTATASLIASAPSVANMTVSGQANLVVVGSAASTDTIGGSSNIVLSNASYLNAAGSNNIVISAYGGSQSVDSTETASILIGGAGGGKLKSGGYQKTMIQPNYGAEIYADHSTIICGSGKIYGVNSTIFASLSDTNEMYGGNNLILGGGNSFVAKIGDSSHQQNSGNSIVANANGTGTISDGAGNTIAFCQGGSFTVSTGAANTILGCSGSATISGGTSNAIIGGYGNITIPSTTSYTVVLGNPAGNSSFTASASNTVYMQNANASGTFTLGGAILKEDSSSLKVSFDGGTTWLTVSAS